MSEPIVPPFTPEIVKFENTVVQFTLDYVGPYAQWELAVVDSPTWELLTLEDIFMQVARGESKDVRVRGLPTSGVCPLIPEAKKKQVSVPTLIIPAFVGDTCAVGVRSLSDEYSFSWSKSFVVPEPEDHDGFIYVAMEDTLTIGGYFV